MKKIMTRLLSLVLLGTFIPSYVLAADWDLDKGSITVSATVESQTVSQAGGSPTVDSNPVITSSSGTTNNTVTITAEKNATANVTLENVNIDTGKPGGAAITTSGEGNVNIELDGTNTVQSGNTHAGVEKKGDGTLTITDENKDGSLTANGGGVGGAGIGGGLNGTGSDVTISGDAQVKVQGGTTGEDWHKGAAIGNGGTPTTDGNEVSPNTSDLTVEGSIQIYEPGKNIHTDTPDKTIEGQKGDHSWNAGEVTTPATCTTEGVRTYTCTKDPAHTKTEPIPALNHQFGAYTYNNDATCTQDGTETAKCERCNETDTRTRAGTKLGHLFETYVYNNDATTKADGTETAKCERCNETDTRTVKGTKLTEHTAETVPESKTAAYWVCDPEGQSIPYQAQQKDGVLTVTVQADTASLCGTTGSLGQLEAQGITEIRFVTNGAQSAFTLADLLASGTGSFTLTHEAETVTFTLAEKDISGILK